MSAIELNRKRLASIGQDHLQRQLADWLSTHCATHPDASQITLWMEDAQQHGMLTQRATAVWALAHHTLEAERLRNDPELHHVCNTEGFTPKLRTRLLEIWLAQQHSPTETNTLTLDRIGERIDAALHQSYSENACARDTAARALTRVDAEINLACHHLLPRITHLLAQTLSTTQKASLDRAANGLTQVLSVTQTTLLAQAADALKSLPAIQSPEAQAPHFLRALPDTLAEFRQSCQQLSTRLRHVAQRDVPSQCENLRQALDDAEVHLRPSTAALFQQAAQHIDELETLLARGLPMAASSATATATLLALSCADITDDLLTTLSAQAQATITDARIRAALACLPLRFPEQHIHRPIQQAQAVPPLPQPAGLRVALAQIALFDAMQTAQILCPTWLSLLNAALDEQRAKTALPSPLQHLSATIKTSPASLQKASACLPEAIRTLQSDALTPEQITTLMQTWKPLENAFEALAALQQDQSPLAAPPQTAATNADAPNAGALSEPSLHKIGSALQACITATQKQGLAALMTTQALLQG